MARELFNGDRDAAPVKNFCFEDNAAIRGYIGLTGNYIAGLFIAANNQSKGIGKALLDSIKEKHSNLLLHVYKKNVRAVKFYLREGFAVSKEQVDANTGEIELEMNWAKQE